VADGQYPYSTGSLDCSASTLKTQYLSLGTHSVNNGDEVRLWGEAVYPCGTDHGQYTRWYEIRFTPVNTTATQILSPAAGSGLVEGSDVTLTGQGSGTLSWEYDANSDGKGRVAIGTGAQVAFSVPTGVTGPRTVTVFLTSGSGTDSRQYDIIAGRLPVDSGPTPADSGSSPADAVPPPADAAPLPAELPTGYLVWSRGQEGDRTSRKIYRMTLPDKSDTTVLTSGEDIGCQVSYDGKWVAYAKAKIPGADYHSFDQWEVYVVHIDGVGAGYAEVKVADGYWPSWGEGNVLYYSTVDGKHTNIMKVTVDAEGKPGSPAQVASTRSLFPSYAEINECFMSPQGDWFAGRTRGNSAYTGVGAYQISPPEWALLGKAGSAGCMPYVAPDGTWGFHAGSSSGIRWGEPPGISGRQENQTLIPAHTGKKCYHPGISTDGRWVMTGQSTTSDQNAGPWDIYIYRLDPATKAISGEEKLLDSGFNGWPHIWVSPQITPDAGSPAFDARGPGTADAGPSTTPDIGTITPDARAPGLSGGCEVARGVEPQHHLGGALPALVLLLAALPMLFLGRRGSARSLPKARH
jgi:hypothetical protein